MTNEELKAQVAKLTAENEALKAKKERTLSFKVTEKGGVSIYGVGRFPVTQYESQWRKIIACIKDGSLETFLESNKALLSVKSTVKAA